MPNRIRPLRRTGSTGVPVVANMLDGEIAVNAFDKKIWMRVGANLVEIANASSGGGSGGTVVPVTASSTLSSTHINAMVENSNNASITLTLPASLGVAGDSIFIVNSGTSGDITIARAASVALWTYGTNADLVIPPNRAALIVLSSVANKWIRA